MRFGRRKDVAIKDAANKDAANKPWRLSAKLLIVSSVVTVIGFSAVCASVMLDMRHGEEELARQTLENLASGIDADISRNVELYDLSLRAVASNMVTPEINQVSNSIRHLILFDHAATAKHFSVIAPPQTATSGVQLPVGPSRPAAGCEHSGARRRDPQSARRPPLRTRRR